jgi:superfamily I DNA/RNA helicase
MLRFSKLEKYELLDVQNVIEDIYHLKKNNYISDLHDEEIEEIKYYKKLFEDVVKDFEKIGI